MLVNFSEKKKRLLKMSGIFFLIAAFVSAYAYLSPLPIDPAFSFETQSAVISMFCCNQVQKEGFYMISSILCLMGGYCLASGLSIYWD